MGITTVIKGFLLKYATKVVDGESSSYVEMMMDDHKCIEFHGNQYYIPENHSDYTKEDEILKDMLFNTFSIN